MNHGRCQRTSNRGQSTVEYAILLAIVISAFLAIQIFVKQAEMGRMRSVTDQQIGRQWDPFNVSGSMTTTTTTNEKQSVNTNGSSETLLTGDEKNERRATNEKVGAVPVGGESLF